MRSDETDETGLCVLSTIDLITGCEDDVSLFYDKNMCSQELLEKGSSCSLSSSGCSGLEREISANVRVK